MTFDSHLQPTVIGTPQSLHAGLKVIGYDAVAFGAAKFGVVEDYFRH